MQPCTSTACEDECGSRDFSRLEWLCDLRLCRHGFCVGISWINDWLDGGTVASLPFLALCIALTDEEIASSSPCEASPPSPVSLEYPNSLVLFARPRAETAAASERRVKLEVFSGALNEVRETSDGLLSPRVFLCTATWDRGSVSGPFLCSSFLTKSTSSRESTSCRSLPGGVSAFGQAALRRLLSSPVKGSSQKERTADACTGVSAAKRLPKVGELPLSLFVVFHCDEKRVPELSGKGGVGECVFAEDDSWLSFLMPEGRVLGVAGSDGVSPRGLSIFVGFDDFVPRPEVGGRSCREEPRASSGRDENDLVFLRFL